MTKQTVELDGVSYTWTGTDWYESKTFIRPPQVIIRQLNTRIGEVLSQEDEAITDPKELVRRASQARDALQYNRAEKLTRAVLRQMPNDLAALTVLSSVLRARGKPAQALAETEAYRRASHAPLLTTRAAAMCDLERWGEAKQEIGRALVISASEEAFSVMRRIKAACPDLY